MMKMPNVKLKFMFKVFLSVFLLFWFPGGSERIQPFLIKSERVENFCLFISVYSASSTDVDLNDTESRLVVHDL